MPAYWRSLLLAAASFCYLLAFEPGGLEVGTNAGVGMIMIGMILGWVFSRPRPTAEAVIGVPRRRSIRVVMWFTTAMALLFALGAGREGELVEALGWLGLAGAWALQASGAAERTRILLYLSGGVLLFGLLSLGSAFILGEL